MPLSTPVANALIAVTNALIALKTTAGKRRTFADIVRCLSLRIRRGGFSLLTSHVLRATQFMYLPDSTLYADYYQIIPEPRCITGVQVRESCACTVSLTAVADRTSPSHSQNAIEDGTYNTAEEAARDMFLIWANARVYNEATSMVVKDANRLEVRDTLDSELQLKALSSRVAIAHRNTWSRRGRSTRRRCQTLTLCHARPSSRKRKLPQLGPRAHQHHLHEAGHASSSRRQA